MSSLLLLISLLFLTSPVSASDFGDYPGGAVYVRNYDGDTITFNLPNYPPIIGHEINVRVSGIDTPELKGRCPNEILLAHNAQALVHQLLNDATTIDLHHLKRGKYFRIIAQVIVDGRNLAKVLLDFGLAIPYDGKQNTEHWCPYDALRS